MALLHQLLDESEFQLEEDDIEEDDIEEDDIEEDNFEEDTFSGNIQDIHSGKINQLLFRKNRIKNFVTQFDGILHSISTAENSH